MAKSLLIVRGSVPVLETPDIRVVQNPKVETVSQRKEMPTSLNADDMVFKPPGSSIEISFKDFKAQAFKKEEG